MQRGMKYEDRINIVSSSARRRLAKTVSAVDLSSETLLALCDKNEVFSRRSPRDVSAMRDVDIISARTV